MGRRILVSEDVLKLLAEGRVRYTGRRIKLGRWILKEKKGVFIGCKSEAES